MEKKNLYIMVGIPGCGKSYIAQHFMMVDSSWAYVSRDDIRFSMLQSGDKYFAQEKNVYKKYIEAIYENLNKEGITNVIADATHINSVSRDRLIHTLTNKGVNFENINIIPVVVGNDINTTIANNNSREGIKKVPEGIIHSFRKKYGDPKFDRQDYYDIMYVNNCKNQILRGKEM